MVFFFSGFLAKQMINEKKCCVQKRAIDWSLTEVVALFVCLS